MRDHLRPALPLLPAWLEAGEVQHKADQGFSFSFIRAYIFLEINTDTR